MDFRRIEVIFIVVFAVLNAYLFGSYWQYQMESGTVTSSNTSASTSILKEMRNDQITYMPLSNKKKEGYYAQSKVDTSLKGGIKHLTGQNARVVDNKLYSTITDPFTIDPKDPQKALDRFLKDRENVIAGTQYQYNANLSSDTQVVYTQMIDQRPVYSKDGQLIFYVNTSNQVTGYVQGHLVAKKQLREESELISQSRAVTLLYQYNEIPNNSKIEWANLGYTRLLSTDEGAVYVPTWVIGIKNKNSANIEVKRINAFSGVLIKKDGQTPVKKAKTTDKAAAMDPNGTSAESAEDGTASTNSSNA
ncbi:hypothetical protein BTW26_10060 [Pediococcus acidilactici]|jgi:regulatory protein YycI of two-component signal transduction system YycFG|uniref:two-component system regulatory protein YycI n=1 Tax=Pediococcus acidilactici TaxID=1254 RepID=UPI000947493E|nr:two-component system regulatory protein YycI [Pediococcus acidilactici]APR29329.1 hypothetical protein BTW26_10060 [Pediococcus acidilactici]